MVTNRAMHLDLYEMHISSTAINLWIGIYQILYIYIYIYIIFFVPPPDEKMQILDAALHRDLGFMNSLA